MSDDEDAMFSMGASTTPVVNRRSRGATSATSALAARRGSVARTPGTSGGGLGLALLFVV